MSTNDVPVWLLDVDGVLNAVAKRPDPSVWPRSAWSRHVVRQWPLLVAEPVLAFVRAVHAVGAAEIRWHTTWQHDAFELAVKVGLPEFPVLDCPEFHAPSVAPYGGSSVSGSDWWKLPGALRVVGDEGRKLVWTDDDLEVEARRDALGGLPLGVADGGRSLLVSPRMRLGLTPKHLREIAGFLGCPDLLP